MKKVLVLAIVAAVAAVVIHMATRQRAEAPASPARDALISSASAEAAEPADAPPAAGPASTGIAAMKNAADAKKYLFVFFYGKGNEQTETFRKSFEAGAAKIAEKAMSATVDINAASEKEIVEKFRLQNAPLPLVLAIAPNGAITGSYQGESSDKVMLEKMATPALQNCLKPLQEGKLVFLCVQNKTTKSNDAAMKGVNDFKADDRFAKFTEIIAIDPSDTAEKAFLEKLQIDPKADEAFTVFLAPPGAVVAKLKGATNKDGLIATLQAATAGGCGSGGCGPKGCPPTPPPQK